MAATGSTISNVDGARTEYGRYIALALCLVLLVGFYWKSFVALVGIWLQSDTFAHGILIGPIVVYLMYERREFVAQYRNRTSWVGFCGLLVAGAAWWVATVADVQVVQQLAIVAMIPSLVILFLGTERSWQIAFPLAFLFLAVPFGEGLTPHLIELTADFVVSALRWSGIPVFREGTHFVIPSGRWSVIAGCSGMRYLMATITVAALFAYMSYVSPTRRAIFLGAAIAFSIVANWMRAYGIVMIAHLSSNKLAMGIDHYIYGWVFFGIVIFSLMALGRLWQEDPEVVSPHSVSPNSGHSSAESNNNWLVAAALAIASLASWPIISSYTLEDTNTRHTELRLRSEGFPGDWSITTAAISDWRPRFYGESKLLANNINDGGIPVGTFVAWYESQQQGVEVVHAKNVLNTEMHRRWRDERLESYVLNQGSGPAAVNQTLMVAPEKSLLVWQWYWNGGRTATIPYIAKLQQLMSQLTGNGSAGASVVVYTEIVDENIEAARSVLHEFIDDFHPIISESFDEATSKYR